MDPMQAAIIGTQEIGLAVVAITLSLVIVFLPVSFISSVAGRMLFEFGLTATVAILVSMIVSFSLTPMMCSRLLKPALPRGVSPPRAAACTAGSKAGMTPVCDSRCDSAGLCSRFPWR